MLKITTLFHTQKKIKTSVAIQQLGIQIITQHWLWELNAAE